MVLSERKQVAQLLMSCVTWGPFCIPQKAYPWLGKPSKQQGKELCGQCWGKLKNLQLRDLFLKTHMFDTRVRV